MAGDGRLLVVELVLPYGTEPSMAKLLDLETLALRHGITSETGRDRDLPSVLPRSGGLTTRPPRSLSSGPGWCDAPEIHTAGRPPWRTRTKS
jgi:hypothetical protein